MHGFIFNYSNKRRYEGHRIATTLRNQGFGIEVIDFLPSWSLKQLKTFLKQNFSKTKIIIFSIDNADDLSEELNSFILWIRYRYRDTYVIVHTKELPSERFYGVDYYVVGYGEKAFKVLLKFIVSNTKQPKFYKDNIMLANRDYQAAPFPNPQVEYQKNDYIQHNETLSIEFSRGCIYNCPFCDHQLNGSKDTATRITNSFEKQLRNTYDNWGVTNYDVVDGVFNETTSKITKYADIVQQLDFTVSFNANIRADFLNRDGEVDELTRMNVVEHNYGVETFNQSSLKSIGRDIDPDTLKQNLVTAYDKFTKNIEHYTGTIHLIVGLPFENIRSLGLTGRWLKSNWNGYSSVSALRILQPRKIQNSLFSTRLEDYGYTVMIQDEIDQYQKEHYEKELNVVQWKNKELNVFQAIDYANLWQKDINHKPTIANNVEWYIERKLNQ